MVRRSQGSGENRAIVRTSRITPLLAPAAALYLAADAASAARGLGPLQWIAAALGLALACGPLALRPMTIEGVPGARRVGTLGAAVGMGLAASLAPATGSLVRSLAATVALPLAGALVLDLALLVPDRVPLRRFRSLMILLAVGAGVGGAAASLPVFELFRQPVLVPPRWVQAPAIFAFASAGLALLIRLGRRRSSAPAALAANAWAVMGLFPIVLVGAWLAFAPMPNATAAAIVGAAAFAALYGHAAMVDPRRRLSAGPTVRRTAARAFVVAVGVASAVALHGQLIHPGLDRWTLGVAVLGWLLLLIAFWRGSEPLLVRFFAPQGGRLLRATARARDRMRQAATLEELAAAVLAPLRDAAGGHGRPRIRVFDPPLELTVDLAGGGHVRRVETRSPLEDQVERAPGEVTLAADLAALMVRQPELRPVAESLEALEAFGLVPLARDEGPEGCLLLSGDDRGALRLEELEGLRVIGRELANRLASLGSEQRALVRLARMAARNDEAEEALEGARDELDRLREDGRALRAGRGEARRNAPPVAYSAAMRTLDRRIGELAAVDSPVLLEAEAGTPIDRVARRLHDDSARREGPFVIADASGVPADQAATALFGDDSGQLGWLRLSASGTLLLADVPALPPEVQRDLAEALAIKRVRTATGGASHPLTARVVVTSRRPLAALRESGVVEEALATWLEPAKVHVPPLRERRDDMPSLVLLALDRACRVLGREPLGVEQGALEALLAHDWPGNLRELQHVIDRAVARAKGSRVTRTDLPPLAGVAPPPDPFEGTWSDVERRLLENALERADGNKSEAARLLDLKRTTFLDKLRKHGMRRPSKPPGAKGPKAKRPKADAEPDANA